VKKRLKRGLLVVGLVLLAVAVYYGWARIFRESRAVRVLTVSSDVPVPAGDEIRVACYNIAHGRGPGTGADNWGTDERERPLEHIEAIAKQIADSGASIVVLNEVDFDSKWSGGLDFARLIAEGAVFPFVVEQRNFDVTLPFYTLQFGNAILSKFPVVDARLLRFPTLSLWEDRFAGSHDGVVATVETSQGPIRVVAVHLEYRDEAIRVEAAKMIANLVTRQTVPLIAMGDYDSAPSGFVAHQMTDSRENAIHIMEGEAGMKTVRSAVPGPKDLTYPSEAPDRAIDWIFVSDGLNLTQCQVVSSKLSDHFMVVGTIRMAPAQ
jgi:endonuclease/exonuclease/phosphatase family metal-dependent hydrolase